MSGVPHNPLLTREGGGLTFDGVDLASIASEVGTPVYVYSGRTVDEAFRQVDEALSFVDHVIAYAVKANSNLTLLRRLAAAGCGADIVSGGELAKALHAGFDPAKIVFSGVGKRREEVRAALKAGIRSIHIESAGELDVIEAEAKSLGVVAPISIRINPNVDPQTHPYIATGLHSSKFGLEPEAAEALLPRLLESKHFDFEGIATHIGSQLGGPEPLRDAVTLVAEFTLGLMAKGAPIRQLDVGGGWPLTYGHEESAFPEPAVFGQAIREGLDAAGALDSGLTIVTEPGRSLVGDAGILLTEVLYAKDQPKKRFVIVDAAMTELIRPSLYQAYHAMEPVAAPRDPRETVDVVGPVCESGDFLARDRELPRLEPGDLLAVRGAGAYAREMASTYNSRPPIAEVLVDDGDHRVIRKRASAESLWALEE